MRPPKQHSLGTLNRLPRHLVNAMIVGSLNNKNLVRWAGVSRGVRRNTRAQLAVRRDDKEQEVTDAAGAVAWAYKRASNNTWGAQIFKEVVDRLPFRVTKSRLKVSRVPDNPDATRAEYSGEFFTPHFRVGIKFFNIHVANVVVLDERLHIKLISRERSNAVLAVDSGYYLIGRPTVTRHGGFPAQWAKGVEQMLGLRRSPRRHRMY